LEIPQGVVIHTKEWKSKKGHHNNVLNEIAPAEKAGLQENITFLTLMK
jgi:hypothetical protein